ncbi:MAG: sigma-70 family RNA polymerase sigma factor [Bacteroidetes bacterium]|jgi:RNA polymerase sigma factor (TIGR02999 family)|nr:sigma-70 family RNA polymerase sigma factor [Bacteroidota bacterium]
MSRSASHKVTQLLLEWSDGDAEALDDLMPLVYDELRRLARRHLRGERSGHTLNATALVHEAYFNLVDQERVVWQNRAHFFGIASQAMRRILLMHARRRNAQKRGGGQPDLPLDDVIVVAEAHVQDLLALDAALERLAAMDARMARVVECRYFGGLTIAETAAVLDVSPATVKRDWRTARAWLHRELSETRPPPPGGAS